MCAWSASRPVRRYLVRMGAAPVLVVAGEAGRLRSTASPPEGWTPPAHPWLDAVALDHRFEHALRVILLESHDFDEFLGRLVAAGFDVAADHPETPPHHRVAPLSLHASGSHGSLGLVRPGGLRCLGALWPVTGQLASLGWQPEPEAHVFRHAHATAYDPAILPALERALEVGRDFAGVCAALAEAGLRVSPGEQTAPGASS